MKQFIKYKGENYLSYAEYGNPEGYPILIQHGLIASITDVDLFESLTRLGTRLICMARPGYGVSSPYKMKNIGEWGEITSVLVDELDLPQFDVLGMSSGAPYSYAISYKLPEKVRNIFIFSGIPALYDENVLAAWPYEVKKEASLAEMQQLAHDLFFSNVSPEDLKNDDMKDSLMNDCFGIALDFLIRCRDWGFTLGDVRAAVYMEHSREDMFPLAEMTSRLLPHCQLICRESGGHFTKALLDDFINNVVSLHF